eukprot:TRINITY_DN4988_c0_g1_i1.p1 TRINITY_DN4988_c0_g1~~TRINITY_DN4988_c0_g1_i1.p1  ORF type:complete len:295 (+),score=19.88 TRINITY_DN4988_c0_g1_i1:175-1059(+)
MCASPSKVHPIGANCESRCALMRQSNTTTVDMPLSPSGIARQSRANLATLGVSQAHVSHRSQPIAIHSSATIATADASSSLEGFLPTPLFSSNSSRSPTPPKSIRRKVVRGAAPPPSTGLSKISSLPDSHSFTPTRSMRTIAENSAIDYSSRCGTDDPVILAELRNNALSSISAAPRHDWLVSEFEHACQSLRDTVDVPNAALPLRALLTGQLQHDLHALGLPEHVDEDTYVPDNVMSFLENFLDETDLEVLRDAVEGGMSPRDDVANSSSNQAPVADGIDPFDLIAKLNALST